MFSLSSANFLLQEHAFKFLFCFCSALNSFLFSSSIRRCCFLEIDWVRLSSFSLSFAARLSSDSLFRSPASAIFCRLASASDWSCSIASSDVRRPELLTSFRLMVLDWFCGRLLERVSVKCCSLFTDFSIFFWSFLVF